MSMMWLVLLLGCADEPPPVERTRDPRQTLALRSPDAAAATLRGLPESEQFGAAFAYGEGAGARESLPELVQRGEILPRSLTRAYMNGAAHTWSPPDGTPPGRVVWEIRQSVPLPDRRGFFNGVLIAVAEEAGGDPAQVVPVAEAYGEVLGRVPVDGVRIGLQRARGADLLDAIAVAETYPEAWQPALYEELGWRAGDDATAWEAGVCALVETVPAASRCHFVHGAARGRTLRTRWTEPTDAAAHADQVLGNACGCERAAWRGVAWGLALTWDHRPRRAETLARQLPAGGGRDAVGAALRTLFGGHRGAPWELEAG